MISVQEGQARILAQVTSVVPPQIVPLPEALGRVPAEAVRAGIAVPPTDNSAVDGYAVLHAEVPAGGSRELRVVADLPAGAVLAGAIGPEEAGRILPGRP